MEQTTRPACPVLGEITIGTATYKVRSLGVLPNAAAAGIRGNYGLEGPRDASFLVVDHGPRYRLNSLSMTGGSPRPLRGLTREHLAPFGVEV